MNYCIWYVVCAGVYNARVLPSTIGHCSEQPAKFPPRYMAMMCTSVLL